MDFKGIKLNVGSGINEKDELRWRGLIDAIMEGRVIPVIGPDMLVDDENGKLSKTNLHQQLIDFLAEQCEVESKPQTFSQLIYDKDFIYATNANQERIYSLIDEILTQAQFPPSNVLMRLLKTRRFPFVITTSFCPTVEKAMNEVWGQPVKVLTFCNDPRRDKIQGVGDIQNEKELSVPTIYYMFGKHSIEPHRFVVSDLDMMDFCSSWLTGGDKVPRVLTEVLKKRYLLVMGSNYSDWLFRFIWYSMRPTQESRKSALTVDDNMEDSLKEFLNRLQTFLPQDAEFVVKEIERRLKEKESNTLETKELKYDVFVSYSHSDKEEVQRLVDAMSDVGLKVWFDTSDIPGGTNWREQFTLGINNSRIFVPVLTHNTTAEVLRPKEYRTEWRIADELATKMGGRTFIWPLAEKGFDFYNILNKLPETFKSQNATWYQIGDDFKDFALNIRERIDELKNLEKQLKNGH